MKLEKDVHKKRKHHKKGTKRKNSRESTWRKIILKGIKKRRYGYVYENRV